MRKALVTLLTLAAFAAVTATALGALTGTYGVTISGKPAPLDGKWQLKFLSGGKAHILRNGKQVVATDVAFGKGHRLSFTDQSGSYACLGVQKTGRYTYKLSGKKVTFTAVSDKCMGRKLVLTTKPFVSS